jgi:hypothetical protein
MTCATAAKRKIGFSKGNVVASASLEVVSRVKGVKGFLE